MLLVKIACWATLAGEGISQKDFEEESGMKFPEDFDPEDIFEAIFSRMLPAPPIPGTEVWAYWDLSNDAFRQCASIEINKPYQIVAQKGGEPYIRIHMNWRDAGNFNSLGYTMAVFREAGWEVSIQQDDSKVI